MTNRSDKVQLRRSLKKVVDSVALEPIVNIASRLNVKRGVGAYSVGAKPCSMILAPLIHS